MRSAPRDRHAARAREKASVPCALSRRRREAFAQSNSAATKTKMSFDWKKKFPPPHTHKKKHLASKQITTHARNFLLYPVLSISLSAILDRSDC